jgi:hypothetical protein
MPRRRLGSICIGVQNYTDPRFSISEDNLNHAEPDAAWFHEYCSRFTPPADKEKHHLLLQGRAASRAGVKQAFDQLADAGEYDLVLIFLAGHGAVDAGTGWFSSSDAEWGKPDISGLVLDQFLSTVRTRVMLVFVDCCYSASIAAGCPYFSTLPNRSIGRIFLSSSRANQRSWEADDIASGLFTHILRKVLFSPHAPPLIPLEVVFRSLHEELPLLALRSKKGAVASSDWDRNGGNLPAAL